jgi:hypothetical protein
MDTLTSAIERAGFVAHQFTLWVIFMNWLAKEEPNIGSEAMQVSYPSVLVWNLQKGGFCDSHCKMNPSVGWVL